MPSSDQPTYPPQQQPGQPQYGQQPPAGYYQQGPPPKKKHTVRNVLLALVVLLVLFVGGCFALVGAGLNAADKAMKEDASKAGGSDNPLTIKEGKAFEVDGFQYAAGWKVTKDFGGSVDIKGLKVTNNRDNRDSALVEIKFRKGSEVLASTDCTTSPIQPGDTVTLSCLSGDKLPKSYRSITINDSF